MFIGCTEVEFKLSVYQRKHLRPVQDGRDLPKVTKACPTSVQGGFPSITQSWLRLRILPRKRAGI